MTHNIIKNDDIDRVMKFKVQCEHYKGLYAHTDNNHVKKFLYNIIISL